MICSALWVMIAAQPKLPDAPGFSRHTCTDRFERKITYYLSSNNPDQKLPLALIILGSGGQSVWTVQEGRVFGGLQNLLAGEGAGKVRVLVVEKPGVEFGFNPPQPGTAVGCSPEFLQEHTLPRWTEANAAALRDAKKSANVDPVRTLAVGHSEGGIVAAQVAALMPEVTHLGLLSSGGANQIYDLSLQASKQNPQGREAIFAEWQRIQKDPLGTTQFAWGHPYRRWSSFLATSTAAEAKKSLAKVYAAAGTEDQAVPVESFDFLRAELTADGRDAVFERIEGAGHGFETKDSPDPVKGFRGVFQRLINWFLS